MVFKRLFNFFESGKLPGMAASFRRIGGIIAPLLVEQALHVFCRYFIAIGVLAVVMLGSETRHQELIRKSERNNVGTNAGL
ncbi:hypothetical protein [Aneurinibacillus thermoaerophilus]|uniref:hypothetical protein n=1 Tax=Aneurinibacillus thermoaerophilus TaxID=143495 RepID=UPI00399C7BE3